LLLPRGSGWFICLLIMGYTPGGIRARPYTIRSNLSYPKMCTVGNNKHSKLKFIAGIAQSCISSCFSPTVDLGSDLAAQSLCLLGKTHAVAGVFPSQCGRDDRTVHVVQPSFVGITEASKEVLRQQNNIHDQDFLLGSVILFHLSFHGW